MRVVMLAHGEGGDGQTGQVGVDGIILVRAGLPRPYIDDHEIYTRQIIPPFERSAHFCDRPLQLPLHVLHAGT